MNTGLLVEACSANVWEGGLIFLREHDTMFPESPQSKKRSNVIVKSLQSIHSKAPEKGVVPSHVQ